MSSPTSSNQIDQNQTLDYLWKVHGYTNEYIRFADPKAGITAALVSGLIATMFAAKCHFLCSPARLNWENASVVSTLLGTLTGLAFAFLVAATATFFWAISPRLWTAFFRTIQEMFVHALTKGPQKGSIFWEEVLAHGSADEYVKSARQMTTEHQIEAVGKHLFVLAGIANTKFRRIKWGFRLSFVGAILALVVLFVT